MYTYLRKDRRSFFERKSIIGLIVTLTALSLLDLLFNSLGLNKNTIFTIIWVAFSGAFLFYLYKLLKTLAFENGYFKIMFYIFMGYGAITVLRGWSFSTGDLTSFLRVPYIFWPFLIPLFSFFSRKLTSVGYLFKMYFYLGLLFLIVAAIFPSIFLTPKANEILIYTLALGSGFLFMNSNYLTTKELYVSFLVIVVATLSMLYLGRRAGLFLIGAQIITGYILAIASKDRSILFKALPYILLIALIIFFSNSGLSDGFLERINERVYEDTRSLVYDMYFLDMSDSMVIGKGMNATYFCPIGGGLTEGGIDYDITYYREVIENGYLQMMLTGGIVHVVLFILIAIPAIYKGIFQSMNQLSKACGIFILLWLIFMFGSGLPSLSIGYVLVWICIGICYKKSLRTKSNNEIREGLLQTGAKQERLKNKKIS